MPPFPLHASMNTVGLSEARRVNLIADVTIMRFIRRRPKNYLYRLVDTCGAAKPIAPVF